MKKRALAFVLILMLIISSVPIVSAADSTQESGTKSDPYVISDPGTFNTFLNQSENTSQEKTYYRLDCDITAQDNTAIGGFVAENISLDGNGHKISGFSFKNALFKSVTSSEIRNIVFDNISVTADENSAQEICLAVIAEQTDGSTVISDISIDNSVIEIPASTNSYAAAIAAKNNSKILNCVVGSNVIFKAQSDVIATDDTASAPVSFIGGITAVNSDYGAVINCISKADYSLNSTAKYTIGGIAAVNESSAKYCCNMSQSPFDDAQNADNKFYPISYGESKYTDNSGSIYLESDVWYLINNNATSQLTVNSVYELAAMMSESVTLSYNQTCYELGTITNENDYACPWAVENDEISLSFDGKTAVTYFYVDSSLADAKISFTDPNYKKLENKSQSGAQYIVSTGHYTGNEYVRHEFTIEYVCESYKSVNNFIMEPTQKYINSLTNTLDGSGGTYPSQIKISSSRLNEEDLRVNTGSYRLYPFCTRLSLNPDEIIPYEFDGSGTSEDPYQISNEYELACFSYSVNNYSDEYGSACYVLTNDLQMTEPLTPIGSIGNEFKGTFDGQFYTISNLTINSERNYQGMFSMVTGVKDSDNNYTNAVIKNLTLSNVTLPGKSADGTYTDLNGCLVGQAVYTTISNCVTSGTASGDTQLGGIVGYSYYSQIKNCASSVSFNTYGGNTQSGGIAGYAEHSQIVGCYATPEFTLNNVTDVTLPKIGGIAGYYKGDITEVKNSFYLEGTKTFVNLSQGDNTLSDEKATVKTEEQFKSGEVAYQLNDSVTDGTQAWYQNIDNDFTPQDYPVLTNNGYNTVYRVLDSDVYTNKANGSGFDEDIDGSFIIRNYKDLCNMSILVNTGRDEYIVGSYIVVNDIVCPDNAEFTPIGSTVFGFNGKFNGLGHTISNINIVSDAEYVGLFGDASGATIENITVSGKINCTSASTDGVGGIAGTASGLFTNIGSSNAVFRNIHSDVDITTSDGVTINYIGGVLGRGTNYVTIDRCVYTGDISVSAKYVGGVVGTSSSYTEITNCANVGTVKSTVDNASVGGILGFANNTYITGPKSSYNYGSVSASGGSVGAIVGYAKDKASYKTMLNNYYLDGSCANAFGTNGYSGAVTVKSAEQFASGETAYLLNETVTDGTQAWYQNLDNGYTPGIYPDVVNNNHNTVYKVDLEDKTYSNFETGEFDGLDVDEDGNFIIRNYDDLCYMSTLVSTGKEKFTKGSYIVVNDIPCPDYEVFTPIGSTSIRFMGTFNGGGYTISNLNVSAASSYQGLFGYIDGATLKDFTVTGNLECTASGLTGIGGVVGCADNGSKLYNVKSAVKISNAEDTSIGHVGGIVGAAINSTALDKTFFSGSITVYNSNDCIGGVVGYANQYVSILNSASVGTITVKTPFDVGLVGGVLGYINNSKFTALNNCYSYGKITVDGNNEYTGAIVGWARDSKSYTQMANNYYLDSSYATPFGSSSNVGTAYSKTVEQFASGNVCYSLNIGVTDSTQVWYQNLDNGLPPDDYPVFEGGTVYYLEYKNGYSNTYSEPDEFDEDEDGNFIIKTYDDLVKLSNLVRSDYKVYGELSYILVNNIIAPDDSKWKQGIGSVADNKPFNGSFNGNGYCIIGLNVNCDSYGGLFEIIGESGSVTDLFVFDCDFDKKSETAGAIAAVNKGRLTTA